MRAWQLPPKSGSSCRFQHRLQKPKAGGDTRKLSALRPFSCLPLPYPPNRRRRRACPSSAVAVSGIRESNSRLLLAPTPNQRKRGIEPPSLAWEASILPLYYSRKFGVGAWEASILPFTIPARLQGLNHKNVKKATIIFIVHCFCHPKHKTLGNRKSMPTTFEC